MYQCHHISRASEEWPWIGVKFTDGEQECCGTCLPREDSGHVVDGWSKVEVDPQEISGA